MLKNNNTAYKVISLYYSVQLFGLYPIKYVINSVYAGIFTRFLYSTILPTKYYNTY